MDESVKARLEELRAARDAAAARFAEVKAEWHEVRMKKNEAEKAYYKAAKRFNNHQRNAAIDHADAES